MITRFFTSIFRQTSPSLTSITIQFGIILMLFAVQIFDYSVDNMRFSVVRYYADHRRRIKREEKTNVVAVIWGMYLNVSLTIWHRGCFLNKSYWVIIYFFKKHPFRQVTLYSINPFFSNPPGWKITSAPGFTPGFPGLPQVNCNVSRGEPQSPSIWSPTNGI